MAGLFLYQAPRSKKLRLFVDEQQASVAVHLPCAARKSSYSNEIQFPADEVLAYKIIQTFPGINVHEDVKKWLKQEYETTKKIASLRDDYEAEFACTFYDRLWHYQKADVAFMRATKRSINGNQMALGKTVEALALIDSVGGSRNLIVASKSLKWSWHDAIVEWLGEYPIVAGAYEYQKQKALKQFMDGESRFLIINRETLRNQTKYPQLFKVKWDVVVVDEAHHFVTHKSQQYKGLKKLKTEYLTLLSGTIIQNKPYNVFTLLQLCDPKRFTSFWNFVDIHFVKEIDEENETFNIGNIKNVKNFQYMLSRYAIARKKRDSDVMPWLPKIVYKTITVEPTPELLKWHKELANTMSIVQDGEEITACANQAIVIQRLRQLTLDPEILGLPAGKSNKTEAIMDVIEKCIAHNMKIVLFTYYRAYFDILLENLRLRNINHVFISQEVKDMNRRAAEKAFQTDPNVHVILGTIGTMSEGFNLQSGSVVMMADKSVVPGTNDQCYERIDRPGRTGIPYVISFVTKGTVEVNIEWIVKHRKEIVDEATAIAEVIKLMKSKRE